MTKTVKPKSHGEQIQQQVEIIHIKLKTKVGKSINSYETCMKSASVQEDAKNQWAFEGLEYLRTVTVYSLDNMIENLKRESKNGKGLAQYANKGV